jgi:hypothetical protein
LHAPSVSRGAQIHAKLGRIAPREREPLFLRYLKFGNGKMCVGSSLRANGSRECAPDDRFREAIQNLLSGLLDCFVAFAPLRKRVAFVAGNDELVESTDRTNPRLITPADYSPW